ncbi:MAG: LPS assembly protein LptD, partial [Alphaproteobacteria bacterium]|nr:LPS assembly protein LptD [Alphaproteobacteria bacterium]
PASWPRVFLPSWPSRASANQFQVRVKDKETLILAEEIVYDPNLELVVASGRVEIVQDERILRADRLTYNLRTDSVIASGNVALLEPTGDVLFAEYVELHDAFKTGVARKIRLLMSDRSRFAANEARREGGRRLELDRAVFSPCELCKDHPDEAPLWQIKADKVVHDSDERTITYTDATFEVYGVPIFYTPYFQHPDPTVERKTGLLTPTFRSSTELGFDATVPFYWNIAPHRDMTIAPAITTKEGVVMAGEYRERTTDGEFSLVGSGTYVDERDDNNKKTGRKDTRGHVRARGGFDMDERWRWGFDIYQASDDTYLKRYDIADDDTLTTNLFLEGFNGRNYASINTYTFQELREGIKDEEVPVVFPLLDYHFIGDPGQYGGQFLLDADGMILERAAGADSRRLSLNGGWKVPYLDRLGAVYGFTAQMRGDVYHVNDVDDGDNDGKLESGWTGRLWPTAALSWQLPMIRRDGTIRQILEPVAQLVVSPTGSNPDDIPNEDSLSLEFDDTNLFSINRFPGRDLVESGTRVDYGLRGGVYGLGGGYSNFVVGQSYRFVDEDFFGGGSGLDQQLSDVVGRVVIAPNDNLDYVFRFRLDPDDFKFRRLESYLTTTVGPARLNVSYVRLSNELAFDDFGNREEINLEGKIEFAKYWTLSANHRRDLTSDGRALETGFGLRYTDECIDIAVAYEEKFTRDRDVEPTKNFLLRVRLLRLGG